MSDVDLATSAPLRVPNLLRQIFLASDGFRLPRPVFALISIAVAYVIAYLVYLLVTEASWSSPDPTNVFICATAFYLVLVSPVIGSKAAKLLDGVAAFLSRRGSFVSSAVEEQPKFALIRILFGFFMAERAFWIIFYFYPGDWQNKVIVAAAFADFIASLFVMVGFFTQVSLAYLIIIQWQLIDGLLGTRTLGNDIASMLSVLLLFANSGAVLSVDRQIERKGGWLGKVVSAFSYMGGAPSNNTLQIAKLVALSAYWCMCVYSLMRHLGESSWMTGVAGPYLLTNNFMSRFNAEFRSFFELGPWAVFLGRVSLWAMLPWYALVLPFVLIGGIAKKYVIAWGCLFFALSLFVLQLGWLAHFEFLFFAALFWERSFIARPGSFALAYDDRCNLCDRTVSFAKRVDIFDRVALRPVSENQAWLAEKGISTSAALTDLHGVETDGDRTITVAGYDLYVRLSRSLLLLFPLYPLLLVGKWSRLGPLAYRYIADRRTRLFGVCQLASPKVEHGRSPNAQLNGNIRRGDPIVPVAFHFAAFAIIYFLVMPAPSLKWEGIPIGDSLREISANSAHVYGVEPIVVFNRIDLKMAENWFTLSAKDASGHEHLLPILKEDGTRLAMHRSDRAYFGSTVAFRRGVIDSSGCQFDQYADMMRQFATTFEPAAAKSQQTQFVYRQYYQSLPKDADILDGRFISERPRVECERSFNLAGQKSARAF